jgi:outer membrane protein TolC
VNVSAADVLAVDPAIAERTREFVATTDTSSRTRAPVRQALKNVEIAKEQLRATRAQRLPSIGVSTNYQRLAYPSDGLPRSVGEFFPNWTAAVAVSFPFFTGGRVRGEELAAEASVVEAEQTLKLTQEGASIDARQAIAELEQAEAAWQASVGTEEQATRAYSIAEVRFREGISTQLELSETRVQLQQALANRARAARDLSVARVRVQLLPNLPLGGSQSAPAPSGNNTTSRTSPSSPQTGAPPTGNRP